jgi:tRNA threonylcarbamoyl adenosine modification protein YeaZ
MTYGLAIHTASPDLGLALGQLGGDRRQQVWNLGRDLSTQLHQYLAEFQAPHPWTDLGLIAVAKGPGGFTGTRLGVVTARALAQQLDIPLFAVSTLAAVAWGASADLPPGQAIAVEMLAQRGEIFGALYRAVGESLVALLPDRIFTVTEWQNALDQYPEPYHRIQATGGLGASVAGVLDLAEQAWQTGDRPHWSEALPFYGQHPVKT